MLAHALFSLIEVVIVLGWVGLGMLLFLVSSSVNMVRIDCTSSEDHI